MGQRENWSRSSVSGQPSTHKEVEEIMKGAPSIQFYPSDWLRDPGLRACSLQARGLWMDMLSFMHEGQPYGHLKLANKDILPEVLARMVGADLGVVEQCLEELEGAGVFSRTPSGTIFSRRMVRDHDIRQRRAQGGIESLKNPRVPRPKEPLATPPSRTEGYPSNHPSSYPSDGPLSLSLPPSSGGSPSSSSSSSELKDSVGPSALPLPPEAHIEEAEEVLLYLNSKSGFRYQFRQRNGKLTANADAILCRMRAGATKDLCVSVIDDKCRQWLNDMKMKQYLAPATLFGLKNFDKYAGQVSPASTGACKGRIIPIGEKFLKTCGQPVHPGQVLCEACLASRAIEQNGHVGKAVMS